MNQPDAQALAGRVGAELGLTTRTAHREFDVDRWHADEAWGLWRQHLCAESRWAPDDQHPWVLEIDRGHISIVCQHRCGASPIDADACEFIDAEIPVTVEIENVKEWTDCGWEYDMYVTIEPDPERIKADA